MRSGPCVRGHDPARLDTGEGEGHRLPPQRGRAFLAERSQRRKCNDLSAPIGDSNLTVHDHRCLIASVACWPNKPNGGKFNDFSPPGFRAHTHHSPGGPCVFASCKHLRTSGRPRCGRGRIPRDRNFLQRHRNSSPHATRWRARRASSAARNCRRAVRSSR
jgi:hypothetical protein